MIKYDYSKKRPKPKKPISTNDIADALKNEVKINPSAIFENYSAKTKKKTKKKKKKKR